MFLIAIPSSCSFLRAYRSGDLSGYPKIEKCLVCEHSPGDGLWLSPPLWNLFVSACINAYVFCNATYTVVLLHLCHTTTNKGTLPVGHYINSIAEMQHAYVKLSSLHLSRMQKLYHCDITCNWSIATYLWLFDHVIVWCHLLTSSYLYVIENLAMKILCCDDFCGEP